MSKIIKKINGELQIVDTIISKEDKIRDYNFDDGWLVAEAVDCLTKSDTCLSGYRFFQPMYSKNATTTDGERYELIAYWDEDNQKEFYLDIDSISDTRFKFFNYRFHQALGEEYDMMALALHKYLDKVLYSDSPVKTNAAFINKNGEVEFINGTMQGKEMVQFVKEIEPEQQEMEVEDKDENEEE